MKSEKSSLQCLIDCIEKNTSVHVCIHDVSGILQNDMLAINKQNHIHYSPMCNAAKTTEKGLHLCFACKALSVKKALSDGMAYVGSCPVGLTEIALPLYIDGKAMCIIYIGNLNCGSNNIHKSAERISKLTGVSRQALLDVMPPQCTAEDVEHFMEAAGVVKNYISLVYSSYNLSVRSDTHWAVRALNDYADKYFRNSLSLATLSKIYYLNENYLGRLYKKHMGKSFSTYLNEVRVRHAREMLRGGDDPMIAVALASGFNNVTYFNRIFKRTTGMTPTEYRNGC